MKHFAFTIKKGYQYADNSFRLRLLNSNKLRIKFKINHGALYDYRQYVNHFHNLIGIRNFPNSTVGMVCFIHTTGGLMLGVSVSRFHEPDAYKIFSTITAGIYYELTITRLPYSFKFEISGPDGEYSYSILTPRITKPNLNIIQHPRLNGLVTLDQDLKIDIIRIT